MKKKATLIGATGLIGGHLLNLLIDDETFESIKIIVRRPIQITHPKIKIEIIDFDDQTQFSNAVKDSEIIFCAIGTTQKKVKGDLKAYRKVDFDIPIHAAQYGLQEGMQQFLLVSSIGANSKKENFYLKLKGEVEDALIAQNIPSLSIFRPSLLLGKRNEKRTVENIGQFFGKFLKVISPKKYKPIEAKNVAKAMVEAAKLNQKGKHIFEYEEMKNLIK